jgi:8-oxo-dGTP diphosphatase
MGAGAVVRNSAGEVLVVKPVYKAGWELPGGAVEMGESPKAACERELFEELRLHLEVGPMLCVDYNSPTADYVESLMFLFDVAPLDDSTAASIRLDPAELSECRFVALDEALELLDPRVTRRLEAVMRTGSTGAYLEDQRPQV